MAKQAQKRKSAGLALAMTTQGDYQRCAARLKALADPQRL